MKIIISEKLPRILKAKKQLEKELNVKIKNRGKELTIKGTPEDEYTADECFDKKEMANAKKIDPIQYCDFGFVAGCIWQDERTWKIQFLDLSKADKGIIKREKRFGRIHLPRNMNLKDAIDMNVWEPGHDWVGISHTTWWNYSTKEKDD